MAGLQEPAPAHSSKRILFQHTFPIPGRPRAGTKQTIRAKKKLPKPKPKGDRKRPPATKAKDPDTAREARREYEQVRSQYPERKEYRRLLAQGKRSRAKELDQCRNCSKQAKPGQTRCPTCAEKHRESRIRSNAKRRAAVEETAGRQERRVKPKVSLLAQEKGDTSLIFQVSP